jgi:hypothetical protein
MYWFESVTNTRKKTQRTIPHFFLFHLPSFENRIWLISSTWSNQGLIPLSVFVWAPLRPINTSLILTSSLYTFPSFISPHCHYKSLFTISQALRLNLQKPIPFRPESLDSLPHSFGIRYYLSRSKQQQSNSDNTSYRRVVRSESCIKSNPRVKVRCRNISVQFTAIPLDYMRNMLVFRQYIELLFASMQLEPKMLTLLP